MAKRRPGSGARRLLTILIALALAGCGDQRAGGGGDLPGGDGPGPDGADGQDPAGDGEDGQDGQDGGGEPGDDGDPDGDPAPAPDWCKSDVKYMYDPPGFELESFPDDFYTVDDEDTSTGVRVWIDPGHGWLDKVPRGFDNVYTDLTGLDGWGTTAGVVIRFDGPVAEPPTGEDASIDSEEIMLLDLGGDEPVHVPYEAVHTDDYQTVILWPLRPLRPGVRHAAVVTHRFRTAGGDCVEPSDRLKDLLEGKAESPEWERMVPRYKEILDKTHLQPHDLSAALAFTTQTTTDESEAVAAWIREAEIKWEDDFRCTEDDDYVECVGAVAGHDFRRNGIVADTTPVSEWELPVTFWLPKDVEGPAPIILLGHGMGGDRDQGGFIADVVASRGIAVMAVDAPFHGEHPSASGGAGMMALLDFFGVDMFSTRVNGLKLRDSWRQASYDKLELLRALELDADIDGDGEDDVDLERIGYAGVSMGGIMGPELLALTDRIEAGLIAVCGGRLSTIVRDGDSFGPLIDQVIPPGTTQGELDRFFPVMQALVERGDPVNYAPHLLKDRLDGADGRIPSVLMQVAIGDETIPNTSSNALARAMDIPHVRPVLQTVGIVETVEAPISGNVADGASTAGMFQFGQVVVQMGGRPVKANHNNTIGSFEGFGQLLRFFETWIDDDAPAVINPYDAL